VHCPAAGHCSVGSGRTLIGASSKVQHAADSTRPASCPSCATVGPHSTPRGTFSQHIDQVFFYDCPGRAAYISTSHSSPCLTGKQATAAFPPGDLLTDYVSITSSEPQPWKTTQNANPVRGAQIIRHELPWALRESVCLRGEPTQPRVFNNF